MPTTSMASGAVHVPLLYTLTAPLHHGAGTAGNTALLRRQDIVLPDGSLARVPYVSGNSIRHGLRAALAWHLARTLGIEDGSLSKPVVDLLWSGGAITRTGAETHLERTRRVEHLLPGLNLLGYSAGSDMTAATLFVNHAHLVCDANAWRLPPRVAALPQALRAAGSFQGEEFGTRHDTAGTAVDRYVEEAEGTATVQMIYTSQVLKAGAVLAGSLDVTAAATQAQRRVLLVALDECAPMRDGARFARLAAKAGTGFGQARLDVDLTPLGDPGQARAWWEEHLEANRAPVLALLTELVA